MSVVCHKCLVGLETVAYCPKCEGPAEAQVADLQAQVERLRRELEGCYKKFAKEDAMDRTVQDGKR